MEILPLHNEIVEYLQKHNLVKKFYKQLKFLKQNLRHPSLNVELLEPKYLRFYSFRVDKRYRAVFIFRSSEAIEILEVNDHYK